MNSKEKKKELSLLKCKPRSLGLFPKENVAVIEPLQQFFTDGQDEYMSGPPEAESQFVPRL